MLEPQENKSREAALPIDPQAEARKSIARAEVKFGPRIGGGSQRKLSKGGCTMIVVTLVLVSLAGIVVLTLRDKPQEVIYQPNRIHDPLTGKWIGRRFYLRLPGKWVRESQSRFKGPGGARLEIQFGSMGFFRMHPRTFSGKLIVGRYTAAAYAYGLNRSIKKGKPAEGKYFSMPPFKGVEALQELSAGRVVRTFAVLSKSGKGVLELRFYLPTGPDSAAWRESDTIFTSITDGLPPPLPPKPQTLL